MQFLGSRGPERYAGLASVSVGVVSPSGSDETFCLSAAEFGACAIPVVAAHRHALFQTVLDGRTPIQQLGLLGLPSDLVRKHG